MLIREPLKRRYSRNIDSIHADLDGVKHRALTDMFSQLAHDYLRGDYELPLKLVLRRKDDLTDLQYYIDIEHVEE